jgi:spermidine synthase
MDSAPERLATAHTPRGELVLRRRGEILELVSNGTFLMDTSNGASERALARLALDGLAPGARVLIGGLGFAFTLDEALRHRVREVVLVEIEADVVAWNRAWWPLGADALADPRVTVVVDDIGAYLSSCAPFDAVLLDVDNGPDWTVTAQNRGLYSDAGLHRLRAAVRAPEGRLCLWSAHASEEFEDRLRQAFGSVGRHDIPAIRGQPDVLYLAI